MSTLDHDEQPYDDRHNTPAPPPPAEWATPAVPLRDGEHIGNDHQEPAATQFVPPIEVPLSAHGRQFVDELTRRERAREFRFDEMPVSTFGTGLIWRASVQSPERADLVNYDWGSRSGGAPILEVSNIELRTIYAHLLETAGAVRAEMRERGMQVDL